jgi:hypothetical protein
MKWLCGPEYKEGDRITRQLFALFPTMVDYNGTKHWVWLEKFEEVREYRLTWRYEAHEMYSWDIIERRGLDK